MSTSSSSCLSSGHHSHRLVQTSIDGLATKSMAELLEQRSALLRWVGLAITKIEIEGVSVLVVVAPGRHWLALGRVAATPTILTKLESRNDFDAL